MARLSLREGVHSTRDWGSPWEARATTSAAPPYGVGCIMPSAATALGGTSSVAFFRTWNSRCPPCAPGAHPGRQRPPFAPRWRQLRHFWTRHSAILAQQE